jgi:hypothetical protein
MPTDQLQTNKKLQNCIDYFYDLWGKTEIRDTSSGLQTYLRDCVIRKS